MSNLKKHNFAGQPTNVGSTFAGTAAGFYISAALKQATSLEYLTLMENIKYKQVIQQMDIGTAVRDASCDFTDHGTLALTEQIIEPKNLQVNLQLCKSNLLDSWESLQMRAGSGAPFPASFDDYVMSYLGETIANGIESSVWTGVGTGGAAVNGEFDGFVGTGVGTLLAANGNAVQVVNTGGAGVAYTVADILDNLALVVNAIPSVIYGREDLYIYMSPTSYRLYIQKLSLQGYINQYSMNDDYTAVYEGIKIAVCQGMPNNQLVAAQKSNMYFGTDLISDTTNIALLDMAPLDGSDNVRIVARYSAGVQAGITAECVVCS